MRLTATITEVHTWLYMLEAALVASSTAFGTCEELADIHVRRLKE